MSDAMREDFEKWLQGGFANKQCNAVSWYSWQAALAHQAERELQLVAFTKLAMLDFMDKTSADILAEFENQVKT